MKWETVIGLEVHSQLSTASKIFSGASTAFGAPPNSQACAVDLALPGVLPVLNKGAVERAIRFGLAIGAKLNRINVFDRKNYFYPDLPKGYQISQLALPIVEGGSITIQLGEGDNAVEKTINLTRAHLEEDAGKSLHEDFHGMTGIDLNRAGTPLLEIVSEPEMRSAAEAVAYARALHSLVTWIGICDGNMQEGSFRVDANVSVRPLGQKEFGTRREIKNLNSFRFLEQAINYEVRWQIEQIEDGHRIQQATVLFDPDTGETRMMRSKEDAHDYRYFPDPDLLPVKLEEDWIEQVRAAMPELPAAMCERFEQDYLLSAYDARFLTQSLEMARYYERTVHAASEATGLPPVPGPIEGVSASTQAGQQVSLSKLCANWIMGEVSRRLNAQNLLIEACPVPSVALAQMISLLARGTINNKAAKDVLFPRLWEIGLQVLAGTGTLSFPTQDGAVETIVVQMDLAQQNNSGELEKIIDEVLAANAKNVEEFRAGKDKAFNALVGQVMKASRGKANPGQVNELLKKKLAG